LQKRNNSTSLVYIVILNYKNWHDVIKCLESVFCSKYEHFKVFVIDNDSQNDSLQNLMDWATQFPAISSSASKYFLGRDLNKITDVASLPSLVFVQNEKNNGFAGGNNIVLHLLADQDAFIWLLNPDVIIADDALSEFRSSYAWRGLEHILQHSGLRNGFPASAAGANRKASDQYFHRGQAERRFTSFQAVADDRSLLRSHGDGFAVLGRGADKTIFRRLHGRPRSQLRPARQG